MTLDEAREHVGAGVVYRPYPGADPEDGVITSVGDRFVFVRYRGDSGAKATAPESLSLLHGQGRPPNQPTRSTPIMTDREITRTVPCGDTITKVIPAMILEAGAEDATILFDFNGVTVRVRSDSDPDLIHRDWSRAMAGYIGKTVRPYPRPELTAEEAENDARIAAENEHRRADERARYEAEAAAKQAATEARLAAAPALDVTDPAIWQSWKDANTDGYGAGIIRYAETWARLMQAEMVAGAELENVADRTSHDADVEGVTGFMYGAAVHCLASCWVHGDRLRRWHNARYGAGDSEGTVNPAVITVSTEG